MSARFRIAFALLVLSATGAQLMRHPAEIAGSRRSSENFEPRHKRATHKQLDRIPFTGQLPVCIFLWTVHRVTIPPDNAYDWA
jgi:hypothetical protein